MIFKVWRSMEGVNNDSLHVEWLKPQSYHVDQEYSYTKIITGRPLPKGISLPLLTKVENTKLVDYISTPGMDSLMFIAEKVINIFGSIQLPKHSLLEVDIDDIKYYAVHFEEFVTNKFVNWKQTSFYIKTGLNRDQSRLFHFTDVKEFINARRELRLKTSGESKYINYKLYLNDIDEDLFYSQSPAPGLYCNQKFIDLVEKRNITGFKFEPITERYPVEGMV